MPISPTEAQMWDADPGEETVKFSDRDINEKYARGEGRIVLENNREKLPGFVSLMAQSNYMDLRPFYQRRPRWTPAQQSLLIESFIMNIPVPPVFLYEKDFNSYEVMDGQQRITAIRAFYNNELRLTGLESWPELNGRRYSNLPEIIRAGIDRRSITSVVLLRESTVSEEDASNLRETVFDRLNTGGIKLERQEIRNALYSGQFNDMIERISRTDLFRAVWGIPLYSDGEVERNAELRKNTLFSKMGDSEIVLRFFALRHADHYRRGMQGFLDIYMRKAARFTTDDVEFLEDLYMRTLALAIEIYEDYVFCPFDPNEGLWEAKPHKAFYDAVMVGLSEHIEADAALGAKKADVVTATMNLFQDHPEGTFTGRGNTKQDVIDRITLYSEMLSAFVD
jgi:hypothetical protein